MKHTDFYIGLEFFTGTGRWRCTDVGTRTICAISLKPHPVCEMTVDEQGKKTMREYVSDDPSWTNGPPYAIAEHVFDEDSIEVCRLTSAEE